MFEIDNKFKAAKIPSTIRFTESLYEELKRVAQENAVSFNLLVLQCCQYALDNMRSEKEKS